MSLARDVIRQLRSAVSVVAAARSSTTALKDTADEIAAEIRAATDGSTAEKPAEAIVRLEQAKVRLDEALAEFGGGNAAIEEYIAALDGGGEASDSPTTDPPTRSPRSAPVRATSAPPPAVQRLAEQLPQRDDEDDPTQALAYSDEDGVAVAFISGRDKSVRAGLSPEYARRWVMDHVESHIAARMREPGAHKRITVVVNNEPCAGPQGCDATMPDIIPSGSSVRFFVADGGRAWHFGTYRGTGKGIVS